MGLYDSMFMQDLVYTVTRAYILNETTMQFSEVPEEQLQKGLKIPDDPDWESVLMRNWYWGSPAGLSHTGISKENE